MNLASQTSFNATRRTYFTTETQRTPRVEPWNRGLFLVERDEASRSTRYSHSVSSVLSVVSFPRPLSQPNSLTCAA